MNEQRSTSGKATVMEQARTYLAGNIVYHERTLIADLLELCETYGNKIIDLKLAIRDRAAEIERLMTAVQEQNREHDLKGRLIHAEDVLGVIAQDGTDYPKRTALEYFEAVNR